MKKALGSVVDKEMNNRRPFKIEKVVGKVYDGFEDGVGREIECVEIDLHSMVHNFTFDVARQLSIQLQQFLLDNQ